MPRHALTTALLGLGLATVLAACGGDGSGESASTGPWSSAEDAIEAGRDLLVAEDYDTFCSLIEGGDAPADEVDSCTEHAPQLLAEYDFEGDYELSEGTSSVRATFDGIALEVEQDDAGDWVIDDLYPED